MHDFQHIDHVINPRAQVDLLISETTPHLPQCARTSFTLCSRCLGALPPPRALSDDNNTDLDGPQEQNDKTW